MSIEDELKRIRRELNLLKRENNELREDIEDERRSRVSFIDKYTHMNERYLKDIRRYVKNEISDRMYKRLYEERMRMINNKKGNDITFIPYVEEGFKSDTEEIPISTLMERFKNRRVPMLEAPREVLMIEAPKERLMLERPEEILMIEQPKHLIKKDLDLIRKEMSLVPFKESILPFNGNRMEED